MKNTLNKKVFLETTEEFTIEELAETISKIVEHDDAAIFIALLDKFYQSWEVTEACINHFDAVKKTYQEEIPEEEQELKPKNLLA